jgi:uncharacterized membrane protein
LVILGATLISVTRVEEPSGLRIKGVIAGLGAALGHAIAAFLVKLVISEVGSPITAVFIAFVAASAVLAILFSRQQVRDQLLRLERRSLIPFIITGIFSAIAQLLRYTALAHSPLSLVEPVVMSTNALFLVTFSFLINRSIEVFNLRVILGLILTVFGAILLFQ